MKESFLKFKEYIRGKRVAVLGIGISNRPLIKYLAGLGAMVTACDKKSRDDIGGICGELEGIGVELRLGSEYLTEMNDFQIIFKTPSLRPDIPELVHAAERGAVITSEMEEFVKYCPAQMIGVTGSAGKTTTTTLIYKMLQGEGYRAWLGGNIGAPLFDRLDQIGSGDKVVLELSSFQLMTMNCSPDIAVITNLSPNHLDIHRSMAEYVEAKKNIFRHQGREGILILNLDNEITRGMKDEAPGEVNFFSRRRPVSAGACLDGKNLTVVSGGVKKTICGIDEVKLPGLYNVENLLAACAAVRNLCGVDSIRKAATTFTGVEHRREFVREVDGIKYYDDSIASTPTRVLASLSSFDRKVILIAGGYDKRIPFDELASKGLEKIKLLILIGVTAPKIESAFKERMEKTGIKLPILKADSLDGAVELARSKAKKGDIVTLSPACASFDMFKNFEERGNMFKEIVNRF